jgi:hypothetical protein
MEPALKGWNAMMFDIVLMHVENSNESKCERGVTIRHLAHLLGLLVPGIYVGEHMRK